MSEEAGGKTEEIILKQAERKGVKKEAISLARDMLQSIREEKMRTLETIGKILEMASEKGSKISSDLSPYIAGVLVKGFESLYGSPADDLKQIAVESLKTLTALKSAQILTGEDNPASNLFNAIVLKILNKHLEKAEKYDEKIEEEIKALKEERRKEASPEIIELHKEIENLKKIITELLENLNNNNRKEEKDDVEDLIDKLIKLEEKSKKLLEARGYKVEKGGISPEEFKRMAEEMGLKVVDAKIPLDEHVKKVQKLKKEYEKKAKEFYKKGYERALRELDLKERKMQLESLERIITKAFDNITQRVIEPIVEGLFSGTVSEQQALQLAQQAGEAVKQVVSQQAGEKAGEMAGKIAEQSLTKVVKEAVEAAKEAVQQ